ncbi:hypothetical protein AAE02nite_06520 [Adhaeribacter aerolatus]|uniref:Lipoprotein n=1 Tax=Adhaeribacter aerolatus TaxID=670289 RepID=A0A512ATG7_9BACT|nr:hypothetical protein [Adhaeribacter aerolatus]GEO02988.1 hypothetical protein AAE02nite_06520 [Adhaeribacter aerolatus]
MKKIFLMLLATGLFSFAFASCDSASQNNTEERTEAVDDANEDEDKPDMEDEADEVEDGNDKNDPR